MDLPSGRFFPLISFEKHVRLRCGHLPVFGGGSDQDADVIGLACERGLACVNLVMVRGGRHLGDRSFFPQNAQEREPGDVLQAFIAQHYLERPVPALIVTGEEVDAVEAESFFSRIEVDDALLGA